MNKPVIGITCSFNFEKKRFFVNKAYTKAISKTGGIPVVLPIMNDFAEKLGSILKKTDGLLLSGGTDIDPNLFGEEPAVEINRVDPERDSFELALTRRSLKQHLPVLAICRGIQVLNVAAGGSLYQDIGKQVKDSIKHSQDAPRWHPTHQIEIEKNSLLFDIIPHNSIKVNSMHHQSIKNIGSEFKVVARGQDGIIEAIESKNSSFQLGIQWHPEEMVDRDANAPALFERLIEESK